MDTIFVVEVGSKSEGYMSNIIINDLTYYYTEYYQPVFEHVNLNLDTDWKLGLIGRNGRGKTTFLNLLNQTLQPCSGLIRMDKKTELFPYEINETYALAMDVIKENIGGLKTIEVIMDEIITSGDESRMEEYQRVLSEYMDNDGFCMESRIKRELNYMQLPEELLEREYQSLSGGEKTKMQIIALFLRNNAFVLLDEPTNHLDIHGKEVLASYLQKKKGFLIVSHDRDFLDQVIDHVLSINKADIELEKGNYSSWKANKDAKEAFEFRTQARLVKEISSLEKLSQNKREWASVAEKTKNAHGKFERSSGSRSAQFMMHAKNAEQEAKENLEKKKELLKNYEVAQKLAIHQNMLEEPLLVSVKGLSFSYHSERMILNHLNLSVYLGDRIWIKGGNGTGKSTLLKLLMKELLTEHEIVFAEGLTMSQSCQEPLWKEGYLSEHVTSKEEQQRILEFCQLFDIPNDTWERPIETFSGGEKRKLDIARAFASDNQLILLDEPLNYMDVYFREQLELAILEYEPTIIFVEHDERFGHNVATKIIEL